MKIFPLSQEALLQKCFLLSLLFVSFCYAEHKTVEVVGVGECSDCAKNSIKTSQAFSGTIISGCIFLSKLLNTLMNFSFAMHFKI